MGTIEADVGDSIESGALGAYTDRTDLIDGEMMNHFRGVFALPTAAAMGRFRSSGGAFKSAKAIELNDVVRSTAPRGRRVFAIFIHTPLGAETLRVIIALELADRLADIVPATEIGWTGHGVIQGTGDFSLGAESVFTRFFYKILIYM